MMIMSKTNEHMTYRLIEWQVFKNAYPKCIYPKYNIRMGSFRGCTHIFLETLVESRDGKWLTYVTDRYSTTEQYEPTFLEGALKNFSNLCYITHNNYIYNRKTAIRS